MRPAPIDPAPPAAEPFVLRGRGSSCRVRRWSGDPTVAQLVLYDQRHPPTPLDIERWTSDLAGRGFAAVRTGALNTAHVAAFVPHGFTELQRLALLEHRSPRRVREPTPTTTPGPSRTVERRLLDGELAMAAEVDRRAFTGPWALDVVAISDVCGATARHRSRCITVDDRIAAYAVSGRDRRLGFLQRLAVDPEHQRRGLGRALVLDSLGWVARWRVERVLVNTDVGNHAALALYASVGFVRLSDGLTVLERRLS